MIAPEGAVTPGHMIHRYRAALPCSDLTFRFGPAPLSGNDWISLANAPHAVSLNIFTPSA